MFQEMVNPVGGSGDSCVGGYIANCTTPQVISDLPFEPKRVVAVIDASSVTGVQFRDNVRNVAIDQMGSSRDTNITGTNWDVVINGNSFTVKLYASSDVGSPMYWMALKD